MRLNDLGKLGLGLFVLGLAGIAGFIYDAPAKVSPRALSRSTRYEPVLQR